MNADGAFDALWGYLRTLWRLAARTFDADDLVMRLSGNRLVVTLDQRPGIDRSPSCRLALPDRCRLFFDGFRHHPNGQNGRRISPLAFFQRRHGSVRRMFRQEKRHV